MRKTKIFVVLLVAMLSVSCRLSIGPEPTVVSGKRDVTDLFEKVCIEGQVFYYRTSVGGYSMLAHKLTPSGKPVPCEE